MFLAFRSRILAVFLSASFAVQLVLAGVGTTCVREGSDRGASAAGSMAGMDMPGAGRATAGESRYASADAGLPARSDAPCNQTDYRSICQILSACATGFVTVAQSEVAVELELAVAVPALQAEAPTSRSVAPELPPPRA